MKALLVRTSFCLHLSMGYICICLFIPLWRTRKPSRCQLPVVRFIQRRVCSEHRTLSQLDTKACCQWCEKEKQREYVLFIKKIKVSMWLMCVLCVAAIAKLREHSKAEIKMKPLVKPGQRLWSSLNFLSHLKSISNDLWSRAIWVLFPLQFFFLIKHSV